MISIMLMRPLSVKKLDVLDSLTQKDSRRDANWVASVFEDEEY